MPRSKNVNTYPAALWKICERCAVGKEEFEMELSTIQKALSLQGQFYAFRGALRKEYDEACKKGKDPAWEEKLKAYLDFSANTVCWVDRPGANDLVGQLTAPAKLKFMHRDKTPANEIFEELLTRGKSPGQVVDDAEKSLQEMLSKVNPDLIVKS